MDRDVVLSFEFEIEIEVVGGSIGSIEFEIGGSIGMGKGQASLMVVLTVVCSSISSSDSSSIVGIMLPVTCSTVEYLLTLGCPSRSVLVSIVINFVEVSLLQFILSFVCPYQSLTCSS